MDKKLRSNAVYEIIKSRILAYEYPPEYPLSEESLAEELKVSRTPVREALKKLENEKLIEIRPYRGAFVKGITVADINDIFLIREALEGVSARIAADLINEVNLKMLDERLRIAQEKFEQGLYEESSCIGNEIHDVILRVAGNERILQIVSNLHQQTTRLKVLATSVPGRLEKSNNEHRMILEALKNHDPELAEQRMKEHISSTKEDLINAFKNDLIFSSVDKKLYR